MGTIKIKGYATKDVSADIVNISISFTSKDAKLATAMEGVRKQSEVFLKELEKIGFDIKEFQLNRDRSNEDGYGEKATKSATRTISLCCKFDPKIINTIISVITKNQLEASIDTEYSCSKQDEIHKELLQEAIQNSKDKAEALAAANGQAVKYAELISDYRDDCYEKIDYSNIRCGNVTGIILDDELLSNALTAKLIKHSETVFVTWFVE